jgi:hypothetical protein
MASSSSRAAWPTWCRRSLSPCQKVKPAGRKCTFKVKVLNPLIKEIVEKYNEVDSKILGPLGRIRVAL